MAGRMLPRKGAFILWPEWVGDLEEYQAVEDGRGEEGKGLGEDVGGRSLLRDTAAVVYYLLSLCYPLCILYLPLYTNIELGWLATIISTVDTIIVCCSSLGGLRQMFNASLYLFKSCLSSFLFLFVIITLQQHVWSDVCHHRCMSEGLYI